MKQIAMAAMLACLTTSAWGDWQLKVEQSSVDFISVKNAAVSEVHHFTRMDGKLDARGEASFSIDLTSVETGIAIRNERMQKLLFNTAKFASAAVTTQVDMALLQGLQVGQFGDWDQVFEVDLHGVRKQLTVPCRVTALADGGLQIVNRTPVLVNAADFGLQAGVQALQAVAKLSAIAPQVPVNFNLVFTGN
jgi:polyisoprenoid-binding protein YceI